MQRFIGILLSFGVVAAISLLAFTKFYDHSGARNSALAVTSEQPMSRETDPFAYLSGVEVGSRFRYRVEFESGYKLNEGGFDITGRTGLIWTVVAQTPEFLQLRGELNDLRMSSADGSSPFASLDARGVAQAGERPFYVVVQRNGRIDGIYAHSTAPVWLNSIRRSLTAAFQVVSEGPSHSAWETQERDVTGEVVVQYARTGSDRIIKTKKRYARVRQDNKLVDGNGIADVTGSAQVDLQKQRAIRDYVGRESLTLHFFDTPIVAQAQLTLHLEQSEKVATEPADLRGYVFVPLFGAAAPRQLQVATGAADRDLKTLLGVLGRLPETAKVNWDVVEETAALFARDSAAIREAVALLSSSQAMGPVQQHLLTALAETKTEEAQTAVLDVAVASESEGIRQTAMVHVTLLEQPVASTIRRLGQLSNGDINLPTTQAAVLAYGAVARTGTNSDDALTRAEAFTARTRLVEAYNQSGAKPERHLLARALGNSGAPAALGPLRTVATSGQPGDRAEAIGALRFVEAPEADLILQNAFLKDQSEAVRREALVSLDYRPFTPQLEQTLEQGLYEEPSASVRKDVLTLLVKNGSALAEDLVRRSAEADPSENVRTYAAELLQRYSK